MRSSCRVEVIDEQNFWLEILAIVQYRFCLKCMYFAVEVVISRELHYPQGLGQKLFYLD